MTKAKSKAPLFSAAEVFYIQQHVDTVAPKDIAKTLGRTLTDVKKQVREMQNADRRTDVTEIPVEDKPRQVGKFNNSAGVTSMTGAQSQHDDENAPKGPNKEWLKRYAKNIHYIKQPK